MREKLQKIQVKRLVILNLPYFFIFYVADKGSWLYRHCLGESMVQRLGVMLVNFRLAFLSWLPSIALQDLTVGVLVIKNDLLEQYGISAEQLHEDAMKSSPHVMIPEVSSIGALIDEMYQKNILMLTPDEREMLQETLQESSEMPTFFVVTNTDRIDGAGVIFYPEFMDNMGELLGNDFFILPSSIHEMLVLPDDGQVDAEMLRDMVKEVNATQVAPAERLTNDVYHFDTKDHVFEKADRFTERQKEKEAQAAKTEKTGKEQPDQKPKTKKHDMEL